MKPVETLPLKREYIFIIGTQFIKQIRLQCHNPINLYVPLGDQGPH